MKHINVEGTPYSADVDFQKMTIYKNGQLVKEYKPGDYAIFDFNEQNEKTWISIIKSMSTISETVTVQNSGSQGFHLTSIVRFDDFIKWNAEFDGDIDKSGYIDCTEMGWYNI